ncbi:MAG: glycerol-3-phosphate 1-O-acyltransferase PlsY [Coleofasciculaceae cyanobacterium RL_1_1]|nr:glycerol-3-phosphate 1-O-acyltransferase PlsY [Coleofasciculaceae cyanobacterium RL_1_1]
MVLWLAANAALFAIAYLLGSMPTGYWVTYRLAGFDIRRHGSKSTGATNVLRVLGKKPALFVFIVDILKAVLAIAIVRWVYVTSEFQVIAPSGIVAGDWQAWIETFAGILAIVGHTYSLWLMVGPGRDPELTSGGKAVASSLGVLLALSWPVGLATFGAFASVLAISRIVSLGSIVAGVFVAVLMPLSGQPLPYCLFAALAGSYVVVRHRANIARLRAGTEPRIGQKEEASEVSDVSEVMTETPPELLGS